MDQITNKETKKQTVIKAQHSVAIDLTKQTQPRRHKIYRTTNRQLNHYNHFLLSSRRQHKINDKLEKKQIQIWNECVVRLTADNLSFIMAMYDLE